MIVHKFYFLYFSQLRIAISTANKSRIDAIDWVNGSDSLSLVFASPLTTAGGTIPLNNIASDFNGGAVSGSVTDVPEPSHYSRLRGGAGVWQPAGEGICQN
jgi:hypothetical protein